MKYTFHLNLICFNRYLYIFNLKGHHTHKLKNLQILSKYGHLQHFFLINIAHPLAYLFFFNFIYSYLFGSVIYCYNKRKCWLFDCVQYATLLFVQVRKI